MMVVYGSNEMTTRRELWVELKAIAHAINNSDWLMIGDFNVIQSS